jgi:hypothetical protein
LLSAIFVGIGGIKERENLMDGEGCRRKESKKMMML